MTLQLLPAAYKNNGSVNFYRCRWFQIVDFPPRILYNSRWKAKSAWVGQAVFVAHEGLQTVMRFLFLAHSDTFLICPHINFLLMSTTNTSMCSSLFYMDIRKDVPKHIIWYFRSIFKAKFADGPLIGLVTGAILGEAASALAAGDHPGDQRAPGRSCRPGCR
jgi:hypothetical protein